MKRRSVALLLAAAIASVAVSGCGSGTGSSPTPTAEAQSRPATPTAVVTQGPEGQTVVLVYLSEPSGRYQTGTLTLTSEGNQTRVQVSVSPPQAQAQPMHVHKGTCDEVGAIVDILQDVVGNTSETVVGRPLSAIADGTQVVNVHLSASEFATYTACGDIPELP